MIRLAVVRASCFAILPLLAMSSPAATLQVPGQFATIQANHVPGQTVVVAEGGAFGARIAHEVLGVPLVTMHTCPLVFRSMIRPAVEPLGFRLPRKWALIRKPCYWFFDRFFVDRLLAPINKFRQSFW